MYSLGFCYELGYGVEIDLEKSLAYYKKAMDQGYKNAKSSYEKLAKKLDKGKNVSN